MTCTFQEVIGEYGKHGATGRQKYWEREKMEKERETEREKKIRPTLKVKKDYYKTQRDGYKHLNDNAQV